MTDVLDLAERLWTGEVTVETHHPVGGGAGGVVEIADGIAFWHGFSNSTIARTDAGLVMVDSGDPLLGRLLHEQVRGWQPDVALHSAVYSHGHIDHVFGIGHFDAESQERGWPRPVVHAQEALPARFDRYRLTAGYNATVNRRQFGLDNLQWPVDYRYPDATYRGVTTLDVGERVELHAARGETDDHTWTWFADRRVLCCGDLFIWASPNAGNPQKVQRYAAEWAVALREMLTLDAEVLLPGHGGAGGRRGPGPPGVDRHGSVPRVPARADGGDDERRRLPRRHRAHRASAGRPRRPALPAAGLRRARVRRAQHLAAVRRLVGRRPVVVEAGTGRAAGERARDTGRSRCRQCSRGGPARGRGRRFAAARRASGRAARARGSGLDAGALAARACLRAAARRGTVD